MMNYLVINLVLVVLITSFVICPSIPPWKPNPTSCYVCDTYGTCKDTAEKIVHKTEDKVKAALSKTKDTIEEHGKETTEKLNQGVGYVIDTADTIQQHIKRNSSIKIEQLKEKVSKIVGDTEKMVDNTKEIEKHDHGETFYNVLSGKSMKLYMEILHLMGFVTAYGTWVWITFISTYVLSISLPRRQFAMAQSRIYPIYFKAMGCSITVAFLGHLFSQIQILSMPLPERLQVLNLLLAFLFILTNSYYVGPSASKVEMERWNNEGDEGKHGGETKPSSRSIDSVFDPSGILKEPGKAVAPTTTGENSSDNEKLSKKLRKLNIQSSGLNLCTMICLTWHLVYTAHRL